VSIVDQSPVEVEVQADVGATSQELAAVTEAFKRAGFVVRPEAVIAARSAGLVPWLLYVTISAPIAAFFTSFASRSGSKAADDVYPLIRQWVEDLWAARRGAGNGTGSVVLQDSRDSQLVLSSTLPEEALEALRDVDWAAVEGDYPIWSEKKRQWLDQMKHPSAI
jgi:hypothetical protein